MVLSFTFRELGQDAVMNGRGWSPGFIHRHCSCVPQWPFKGVSVDEFPSPGVPEIRSPKRFWKFHR
jgi:hypothetical protein